MLSFSFLIDVWLGVLTGGTKMFWHTERFRVLFWIFFLVRPLLPHTPLTLCLVNNVANVKAV